MTAFGLVQQQGAGQLADDLGRRSADPPLLEPDQVVGADVDQLGELLTAQARHPAADSGWQADELGRDLCPARAQEGAELLGATHASSMPPACCLVTPIPGTTDTGCDDGRARTSGR